MTLIPSSRTSLGTPVWEGISLDGIGKIKVTGSGEHNSSYRLNQGLGQHRTAENCGVLQIGGTTMNTNNIPDGAYNGRMKFEFPVPVTIISHEYKSRGGDIAVNPNADGRLEYSDDGVSWTASGWTYGADIVNKNTVNSFTINVKGVGSHKYWRFYYPTKNGRASSNGTNSHGLTRWGYIVGYDTTPIAPPIPSLAYGDKPITRIMMNNNQIRPPSPPPPQYITLYIDQSKSNPAQMVTLGEDCAGWTAQEFDDFFGHRPVLLDASGNVFRELDRDDFTKDVDGNDVSSYITGAYGEYNVMIEFPRRGLKMSTSGDIITLQMTIKPDAYDEGFHYYAHTRGPVDLSSEDTADDEDTYARDNFYIGAYKGFNQGGKLRSISGVTPTVNTYIYDFRTAARAMGTGYEQSGFYQVEYRKAMYLFKYKNTNSQATLGQGYTGGSAAQTTGATNTNGMDYGSSSTTSRVKLFGVEDVWGNVWEWIDGLNISNRVCYASTDCNGFVHDKFTANYYNVGTIPSSNNYITKVMGTTKGMFLGSTVGGNDTTYYSDHQWQNSGSRVAYSGGGRVSGSTAGVFLWRLDDASSYRLSTIGARLMFL